MRAFGFDYRLRAPERPISVEDYRRAARRRRVFQLYPGSGGVAAGRTWSRPWRWAPTPY